jgi:arginine-tRNA-protein transferase
MQFQPRPPLATETLTFVSTPPHRCSYLPDREARTLVADPGQPIDTRQYSYLAEHGFRRSGRYFYRPNCERCNACVPVRVSVNGFLPNRSQRRIWKRNQGLTVAVQPPVLDEEHFQLYKRYLAARHGDGEMAAHTSEEYLAFLTNPDIESAFVEFRDGDRLVAVATTDTLEQGLSAIYTFFDPDCKERGLGVYTILWQLHEARRRGLPWLYLGYWISECRKMRYKMLYRPQQLYRDGRWTWVDTAQTA